jgi:hypothetical protein
MAAKDLWGYTLMPFAARACLQGLTSEGWDGHEVFFVISPLTASAHQSEELRKEWWPDVPVRDGYVFTGRTGFFDCSKAERLLGWKHE